MAAANYMTELDVESIWANDWDTTRFGKIGVRIAKILNFLISADATSQVTNTGATPILEQISEEILLELAAKAKLAKAVKPWNFILANLSKIDWEYYDTYLLRKVRQVEGHEKIEMVTCRLPTTTNSNEVP
jgi:hypothetical protein